MKVLIVTKKRFPNGMASTSRIKCYAKAILSAGIDCEVIIATRTERYGKPARNTIGQGTYDGIPYKYIGGTPLRASTKIVRAYHDLMDVRNTCRYIRKNLKKGDVVLGYLAEDPLDVKIAKTCHSNGIKFAVDLCELPYGRDRETEETKSKRARYLKGRFKAYDGIIAISETLKELAEEHKGDKASVIKVPIMVNTSLKLPERQNVDVPYIFHSGQLEEQKDGIIGVLEAFAKTKESLDFPIRYILTGNLEKSPDKDSIKATLDKYDLWGSVQFLGFIAYEDLLQYQANCSMMVINKHENHQNHYCFATKLGEYLISGRPVITTTVGEAKHWLEDGNNAYIVEDGDVEALADKIRFVFTHPHEANEVGERGREIAEHDFSYSYQGRRIVEFFNQLVQ